MILNSKNSTIILSDETGSVLSYKVYGQEMCTPGGEARSLFTIKLLDEVGNYIYHKSTEAESIKFSETENGCVIKFNKLANLDLSATATVKMEDDECHWHITVDNNTDDIMEWIEFPEIRVHDSLKAEGGEYEIFWPVVEGIIIEDKNTRESFWPRYGEIGGQTIGWGGFYPGSCTMQYMAYYNDKCGIYIGAHDKDSNPKTVEWREEPDGIAVEYRLFTSGAQGHYDAGYDMVTKPFCGDWMDASEIYRQWSENNVKKPEKLYKRCDLPKWIDESPLVMIYPVKGTHDTDDMTPNEYYPYKNTLPLVEKYAEKTDSKIMPLLMHWEGTAPWATPYVWPPYGGEDELKYFVDSLHDKGHFAGVYCSGIGWTTYSYLNPECDFSDKYDETLICRTPDGTIKQSKTIGPPIREGYDMCPVKDKVAEIVSDEVQKISKIGIDYAQYFDQNLGGNASFCYARNHNHPPAPGKWMNDAMIRIFDKTNKDLKDVESKMVIGCECAAAEPFISHLPVNDLRYNASFYFGKPVPAYSYIFHEYINNFMGNQVTVARTLDLANNPHCLLFRLGYSIAAGDMLSVTLGAEGKINWGWGTRWDIEYPDQDNIFTFIKNTNKQRIEKKEFLRYGKMIKPKKLEGTKTFVINHSTGRTMEYPSLLTTRWLSPDGREAQIVVNYLPEVQNFSVDGAKMEIAPLSAVWID